MLDWISKRFWITSLRRSCRGVSIESLWGESGGGPSRASSIIGAMFGAQGLCCGFYVEGDDGRLCRQDTANLRRAIRSLSSESPLSLLTPYKSYGSNLEILS
jgi:hypothetical protein